MKYGLTINNFRTFCALVLGVHFGEQYSLKNDAAHEINLSQPKYQTLNNHKPILMWIVN